MPKKPTEMERIILADGWVFKNQTGSHRNYVHPSKSGKVTIPFHKGKDLSKKTENYILKQAGLK
jgi:predicted RNA binding protein YcfA (HicA-like mRNA interferase family)